MGLARGLERRLEQLVDGLAARLFRGRVHPVELGTRIVREADLAAFDTTAGRGAPNHFEVTLGGDPEPDDSVRAAQRELEEVMEEAAAERGWRLEGPVRVAIGFGEGPPSSVSVEASVDPGPGSTWAHLEGASGDRVQVTHNRAVIGRSSTADLHLPAEEVSRQHALLWREAGAVWITDLGSANGTWVNGRQIEDVANLLPGDVLRFGSVEFTLRVP